MKKQVSTEKKKLASSGTDSAHPIQDAAVEEYLFADEISDVLSNDKTVYQAADNFISRIPDFYLLRSQQLLECDTEESNDLALRTILQLQASNRFSWVPIGISAYRVWLNADAQLGGAGNVAPPDEGKSNALKQFAITVKEKGGKVQYTTLRLYVQLINKFFGPLETITEEDEKTIRCKRIVLLKQLFLLPQGIVKAALKSDNPGKSLNEAFEKRVINQDKTYTIKQFNKEYVEPHTSSQGISNGLDNASTSDDTPLCIDEKYIEPVNCFGFDKAFALYLEKEAQRTKVKPNVIKEIIVSFQNQILLSASSYLIAESNG